MKKDIRWDQEIISVWLQIPALAHFAYCGISLKVLIQDKYQNFLEINDELNKDFH